MARRSIMKSRCIDFLHSELERLWELDYDDAELAKFVIEQVENFTYPADVVYFTKAWPVPVDGVPVLSETLPEYFTLEDVRNGEDSETLARMVS